VKTKTYRYYCLVSIEQPHLQPRPISLHVPSPSASSFWHSASPLLSLSSHIHLHHLRGVEWGVDLSSQMWKRGDFDIRPKVVEGLRKVLGSDWDLDLDFRLVSKCLMMSSMSCLRSTWSLLLPLYCSYSSNATFPYSDRSGPPPLKLVPHSSIIIVIPLNLYLPTTPLPSIYTTINNNAIQWYRSRNCPWIVCPLLSFQFRKGS
jgi:hypothetical protein